MNSVEAVQAAEPKGIATAKTLDKWSMICCVLSIIPGVLLLALVLAIVALVKSGGKYGTRGIIGFAIALVFWAVVGAAFRVY